MTINNPLWVVQPHTGSRPLRLFCFSYAGGSSTTFASWQAALAPDIDVCAIQLPGRGARMGEPLMTSFPELIGTIAQVISNQRGAPYAFFGHSLGGLIAFEVARYCMTYSLR